MNSNLISVFLMCCAVLTGLQKFFTSTAKLMLKFYHSKLYGNYLIPAVRSLSMICVKNTRSFIMCRFKAHGTNAGIRFF